MGIPFEALLPYGVMLSMFAVAGVGLGSLDLYKNGGKRGRYQCDRWDEQMMDRDRRLTGSLRGQTDKAVAPLGFELNNGWKVEPPTKHMFIG